MNKTQISKLALALCAMAISGVTYSANDTGNLTVQATVADACVIGDATINLGTITGLNPDGSYTTAAGNSRVASSALTVQCTNNKTADITFAAGTGATYAAGAWGIVGTDTTTFLPFKLYDAAAAGNTITNVSGLTGVTSTTTKLLYGEVQYAGTALTAQDYSGTVVMTVAVSP